jgi:hypothetical protein
MKLKLISIEKIIDDFFGLGWVVVWQLGDF